MSCHNQPKGVLAKICGYDLPLQVLKSNAGFYIGTADDEGPVSRESTEYYATHEIANNKLNTKDWIQNLYL
ncbi:FIG00973668: hypothetical protein [hydrothermal vent metagenome]|uniref:Uncharacterized protein n=1 Tax=hydrothermal vent metagenome TaxID=652676 RepID=A0A3B0XVE3_9ZZZZ